MINSRDRGRGLPAAADRAALGADAPAGDRRHPGALPGPPVVDDARPRRSHPATGSTTSLVALVNVIPDLGGSFEYLIRAGPRGTDRHGARTRLGHRVHGSGVRLDRGRGRRRRDRRRLAPRRGRWPGRRVRGTRVVGPDRPEDALRDPRQHPLHGRRAVVDRQAASAVDPSGGRAGASGSRRGIGPDVRRRRPAHLRRDRSRAGRLGRLATARPRGGGRLPVPPHGPRRVRRPGPGDEGGRPPRRGRRRRRGPPRPRRCAPRGGRPGRSDGHGVGPRGPRATRDATAQTKP